MTAEPKPKPKPRRRRRPDQPMPLAPLWKRALGGMLFALGGGGFAVWGGFLLLGWIGALRAGQPTIETESIVFGLIPMGVGLGAMGPLFLLPAAATARGKAWQERVTIGLLGLMLAGVAMAMFGGLVVDAVMEGHGYRECDVRYGRRVTFTDWAASGVACPADTAT